MQLGSKEEHSRALYPSSRRATSLRDESQFHTHDRSFKITIKDDNLKERRSFGLVVLDGLVERRFAVLWKRDIRDSHFENFYSLSPDDFRQSLTTIIGFTLAKDFLREKDREILYLGGKLYAPK